MNMECRQTYTQSPSTAPNIQLGFDACGTRRERSIQPRGITLTATVVIQFHPRVMTKVDRAYKVQCFYMVLSPLFHGVCICNIGSGQNRLHRHRSESSDHRRSNAAGAHARVSVQYTRGRGGWRCSPVCTDWYAYICHHSQYILYCI